jgi:hypothetical protein
MCGMPSHSVDLAAKQGTPSTHALVIFQHILPNHTRVGEAEYWGSLETNVLDHRLERCRQITTGALNTGSDRTRQLAFDRWLLT